MTQRQDTTTRRHFQHLTQEKRAQIEVLLTVETPKVQIRAFWKSLVLPCTMSLRAAR